MSRFTLHHGDSREVLKTLAEASVDSIVTDPPYGIRFMGQAWDGADIEAEAAKRRAAESHCPQATQRGAHKSIAAEAGKYDRALAANHAFQAWTEEWAREALRVLKPGGYLLCFAGTRTYHRMVSGVEDAGFEIRDQIGWAFGSGFPKSHNGEWGGTALKPAWEPIVLARKPLIGTVEENWREHGTGSLNIDGCRVETDAPRDWREARRNKESDEARNVYGKGLAGSMKVDATTLGRWPANLIHDGSDEVVSLFPREAGAAAGSAARFFYCAKASREDRNEGCEHMAKKPLLWSSGTQNPGSFQAEGTDRSSQNFHPTVKPTDLMRWLIRLMTPAGGLVLDPFMGSGSTGKAAMMEGMRFVGIDLTAEYVAIARARIDFALRQGHQPGLGL